MTCSNAASGTVMVPGKRMCAVGGLMLPSGTYDTTGRHERIAERLGYFRGECLDPHVVLAQHHVRAALLGPADRDDDGRRASADPVPQFGPRQLVDEHGGRRVCGHTGQRRQQEEDAGPQRNTHHVPPLCGNDRESGSVRTPAHGSRGFSFASSAVRSFRSFTGCRFPRRRRFSISTATANAMAK